MVSYSKSPDTVAMPITTLVSLEIKSLEYVTAAAADIEKFLQQNISAAVSNAERPLGILPSRFPPIAAGTERIPLRPRGTWGTVCSSVVAVDSHVSLVFLSSPPCSLPCNF